MSAAGLECELFGLELPDPILNGSGTFDALAASRVFGEAILEPGNFPFSAFVSKTITGPPRAGNPPFRTWEAPSGMINSIGLPNPGLKDFLAADLPRLSALPVPLIVSVMAEDRDGFVELVGALDSTGGVDGIELNVSCPNVHSGLIVGERPEETTGLLERLRPVTDLPLVVKLTPNVADPAAVAVAAEAAGADGISLVNTLKAAAVDPESARPWLGAGSGGLSGPAIHPIAVQQVRTVAASVSIPVIGMGGVADGESALDLILAGASAVAVGTENFRDPLAGRRVAEQLGEALGRRGFGSVAEARGAISSSG